MSAKSNEQGYTKAGEAHWRKAPKTGDKYLSGVLNLTINGQSVSVAFTVFGNKRKLDFQTNSPDAFIFVANPEIDLSQDMTPDDIPF